jgi:hypothetical protein
MEVGHHDDLPTALERPTLGNAHHAAGIFDADCGTGPRDLDEVGMSPRKRPSANLTMAAPARWAQEGRGKASRELLLAQTRRADQQVGVHGPSGSGS